MSNFDFLIRWLDILSGVVLSLREAGRSRNTLRVTRSGDRFLFRSGAEPDAPLLAAAAIGNPLPEDVLRRAHDAFIVLEWPRERTVARTLTLPAQAQDFLSGVIENQLDRLSPWPVGQILYRHVATPNTEAGRLDIRVLIASKTDIDAARSQLAEMSIVVDRVDSAPDAVAKPLVLWSRSALQNDVALRRRLRFLVGGGIAAYVAICAVIGVAAALSASALQEEAATLAARAHTLQKRADAAKSPSAVAALKPPERAWIWKETAISTVVLLDALSRALPDGAFLEELAVESGKLRIAGLADDAPQLIDTLEKSGRFFEVRFAAPTTRASDGRLFRFSIEAQLAASPTRKGK